MDRFTAYDLEEASFYLYKSDLYIKIDVESNFMKFLELKEMHGVNCLKI